ncbi:MAG TPA: SBBP repeat-containing protein, partial [Ramlibacter sp.]
MLLHWLRRKAASPARRVAPQAEWLEPRLLFSADLGAGWLTPPVTPQDEEVRTLSTKGEYARTAAQPQSLAEAYVTTALNFEKNVGQVRDDIDFIASGSGYTIALSDGDADIVLAGAKAPVHLELVGGKDEVQARGEGLLGARSNYLLGNDESKWLTNIANYRAVLCEDVYRGVDVRYYGTQRQLEYDFIVAAGADASQIRLRFEGAEARLDGEGNLLLRTAEGRDIRFDAPVSYQQGAQGREAVASAYRLHADGSVSITLGDYDRSRELVIDPVLSYASYFGESGTESGVDVAVDALGKVYVAGNTNSTGGVLGTVLGGLFGSTGIDTFVARFNADLTALEWTTRVGGDLEDRATSIAVDAAGSAVVTGWTKSSNFATAGAAETAREGTQDAFVYRLDAGGASRAFATYFGDNNDAEVGNGVALDGSGNIYIAGAA